MAAALATGWLVRAAYAELDPGGGLGAGRALLRQIDGD